jgi:hypothetical protein
VVAAAGPLSYCDDPEPYYRIGLDPAAAGMIGTLRGARAAW